MVIYVILAIAVVLFVWGVIFIFRAYRLPKEEEKVVPISDIREIKNMASEEKQITPNKPAPSITQHVIEQNIKKVSSLERRPQEGESLKLMPDPNDVAVLKEKVNQLTKENYSLQEVLNREIANKSLKSLSEAEKMVYQDKEEKLSKAFKNLEEVSQENFRLQKLLDKERKKIEGLSEGQGESTAQVEQIKKSAEEKIAKIEEEFNKIVKEKEALAQQIKDVVQSEVDKRDLLASVQSSQEKIRTLEQELTALRMSKKDSDQLQQGELIKQLKFSQEIVGRDQSEKGDLQKQIQKLEIDIEQLKIHNAHLLEKGKLLEYELTKRRAQAIGLEQICEDFKIQIEQLSSSAQNRAK